jgi:hypothetical protein
MRWHVDSGDDELVDVVAPLLTVKRVDLGFFFLRSWCATTSVVSTVVARGGVTTVGAERL